MDINEIIKIYSMTAYLIDIPIILVGIDSKGTTTGGLYQSTHGHPKKDGLLGLKDRLII